MMSLQSTLVKRCLVAAVALPALVGGMNPGSHTVKSRTRQRVIMHSGGPGQHFKLRLLDDNKGEETPATPSTQITQNSSRNLRASVLPPVCRRMRMPAQKSKRRLRQKAPKTSRGSIRRSRKITPRMSNRRPRTTLKPRGGRSLKYRASGQSQPSLQPQVSEPTERSFTIKSRRISRRKGTKRRTFSHRNRKSSSHANLREKQGVLLRQKRKENNEKQSWKMHLLDRAQTDERMRETAIFIKKGRKRIQKKALKSARSYSEIEGWRSVQAVKHVMGTVEGKKGKGRISKKMRQLNSKWSEGLKNSINKKMRKTKQKNLSFLRRFGRVPTIATKLKKWAKTARKTTSMMKKEKMYQVLGKFEHGPEAKHERDERKVEVLGMVMKRLMGKRRHKIQKRQQQARFDEMFKAIRSEEQKEAEKREEQRKAVEEAEKREKMSEEEEKDKKAHNFAIRYYREQASLKQRRKLEFLRKHEKEQLEEP